MKKKKGLLHKVCLTIIMSSILLAANGNAKTPNSALNQRKAVVTVHVTDKNGTPVASATGFVFDSRGVIATSCNLIAKWVEKVEYALAVKMENGSSFPLDHLLSNNCANNVALFKVEGNEFPTVRLAAGFTPKPGAGIAVIDRSPGRETALTGLITNVRGKDGIFQVTAPFTLEREGSPVFNAKGEVIGLWTFPPGKRQGRHIVIPVKHIEKEFNKYKGFIREVSAPRSEWVPIPPPPEKIPVVPAQPEQRTAVQEFLLGCDNDRANMYKEAIEAYRRAIRIMPDYAEAYVNLGLAYYKLGRYSEAIDAYKQAIRIKPDAQSVYNKLGAVYIITGEYTSALSSFKQSLRLDPGNAEAHFNLGVAYVIAGDREGAIGEYLILKEIDRVRAENLLELIR